MGSKDKPNGINLLAIHPVTLVFADVLDYGSCRLHNRSLRCYGMMEARLANLAKRMENILKPYAFTDSDSTTVLSFLSQFESACSSNRVLEGIAVCVLPFFLSDYSAASLNIILTFTNSIDAPLLVRRGTEGQEYIYMFIDAVNYLLNLYATDDVLAKAATEIGPFKKYDNQKVVQLAETLKTRT